MSIRAFALDGKANYVGVTASHCDYFQRLNIRAETREEACRIMADLMRDATRRTATGDPFPLLEAKLGNYPENCVHGGGSRKKGTPLSWTPAEGEVRRYLTKQVNFGKASKRMCTIFRLSGRHVDAVRDQTDALILQVIAKLDWEAETAIVSAVMALRRTLDDQDAGNVERSRWRPPRIAS